MAFKAGAIDLPSTLENIFGDGRGVEGEPHRGATCAEKTVA